jgi:glycosyltransferase involved in cell wall biosynthesis
MRIAQVSPLFESVPPRTYGGTERVVSWLVEALTGLGHEVTLFATADSVTAAQLRECAPRALRLESRATVPLAYHLVAMSRLFAERRHFDVIHFHTDLLQFALFRGQETPCLTTLHGRLDLPELRSFFAEFPEMPLASISAAQRATVPEANWLGTVHHGLPETMFCPGTGAGGYLAFIGRLSPEKAPDAAIRIARRAGLPLRIAAKVDRADEAYFEAVVRPLLSLPGVEYIGEIGDYEKGAFLGDARALLFPIGWCEPFGIVMIEAMACGTPVIGYRAGSVPEVLDDGITGFIVADEDEAVAAVEQLDRLERERIRRVFEARFSARRMVADYVRLYERVIERRRRGARAGSDDELANA